MIRRVFLKHLAVSVGAWLVPSLVKAKMTPKPLPTIQPSKVFAPITMNAGEAPEFLLDMFFDDGTPCPGAMVAIPGGADTPAGTDCTVYIPTFTVAASGDTESESENAYTKKLDKHAADVLLAAGRHNCCFPADKRDSLFDLFRDHFKTASISVFEHDGWLVGVKCDENVFVMPVREPMTTFADIAVRRLQNNRASYSWSEIGLGVLDSSHVVCGRIKTDE